MKKKEYKKPNVQLIILDAFAPLNAGLNGVSAGDQPWAAKRAGYVNERFEDDDEY